MTQHERIIAAQKILQYYPQLQNSTLYIQPEDAELLRTLYADIYGTYNINTNCYSCLSFYLNNLLAWHQREHPIWLASQPAPEPEQQAEEPKQEITPKKSKKK